jgi:SAM-dependent methyltransferase
VLLGDYLCHSGTYGAVQSFLAARFGPQPPPQHAQRAQQQPEPRAAQAGLRILDLGCGDAHCVSRALEASGLAPHVASYTGVDMSAPALALARANLCRALAGAPGAAACFVQGDMVGFCRGCEAGGYDVVFASFSLHHLPADQKREVLQTIGRRALAPGGALVLVDVFYKDAGGWAPSRGAGPMTMWRRRAGPSADEPHRGRGGDCWCPKPQTHAADARLAVRCRRGGLPSGLASCGPGCAAVRGPDACRTSLRAHREPPAPAEERAGYMERFKADVTERYELLTPAEKESVLDHVLGYDYPWHLDALEAWGAEAEPATGLGPAFEGGARVLYSAKFFKAVALQRA